MFSNNFHCRDSFNESTRRMNQRKSSLLHFITLKNTLLHRSRNNSLLLIQSLLKKLLLQAFNIINFQCSCLFSYCELSNDRESKALIEIFRFSFPTNKAAPHSPRRQKLNLRMKSLSLDSPESTELHGRSRRYPPSTSNYQHGGSGGQLEHSTPPSNNSRLHCKLKSKSFFFL